MNIVLFALTGIGNEVLHGLVEIGQKPILLVTRQESGAFPYYKIDQISSVACKLGIPVLIGEGGEKEAIKLKPDVIFSATYHRLISKEVISSARQAFNLHPSLLPSYPGKNPFYWALINNEPVTGITIHRLTEKFDVGEIVFQKEVKILASETQGSLRLALAKLAGEATKEFFTDIQRFASNPLPSQPLVQGHFGQISDNHRIVNLKNNVDIICRQIRALTPWPCALLRETGATIREVVSVDRNTSRNSAAGTIISANNEIVEAVAADAKIVFSVDMSAKTERCK